MKRIGWLGIFSLSLFHAAAWSAGTITEPFSKGLFGNPEEVIAIVAAVDQYSNPILQTVFDLGGGPANDANIMLAKLIDVGVPGKQIHAFVSYDDNHVESRAAFESMRPKFAETGSPDRRTILSALKQVASQDVKGKTVLLYFAGHGKRVRMQAERCVTIPRGGMGGADPGRFALVAMDAEVQPSCTGLVFDTEIKELANAIIARDGRFLVVLDACFAGALQLAENEGESSVRGGCSCGKTTSRVLDDLHLSPGGAPIPNHALNDAVQPSQPAKTPSTTGGFAAVASTLETAGGWRYLAVMAAPEDATAEEVCLPRIVVAGDPPQQCHGYMTFAFVQSLDGAYQSLADWKHKGLDSVYLQNGNDVLPAVSFRR